MQVTTISSWVLLIVKALQSYEIEGQKLLKEVGLDPEDLSDPNARYPYEAVSKLWNLAVKETGDPCFGLTLANYWHPTTFHALGFSWMASATLGEALERAVRYVRIVNSASEMTLVESGNAYQLELKGAAFMTAPVDAAYDASIAVLVHMCRESVGAQFNPLQVFLKRAEPDDECKKRFNDYFGCAVNFGANKSYLLLPKNELEVILPTGNAELALANDHVIKEYLSHLDSTSLGFRVQTRIIEQLPSGNATEEAISNLLNISLRTLQRKLRAEGVTFKTLLENTRKELATNYIENSRLSINEVTYMLGFADPSNFTRAFKRWHNMSPSEYRAKH